PHFKDLSGIKNYKWGDQQPAKDRFVQLTISGGSMTTPPIEVSLYLIKLNRNYITRIPIYFNFILNTLFINNFNFITHCTMLPLSFGFNHFTRYLIKGNIDCLNNIYLTIRLS